MHALIRYALSNQTLCYIHVQHCRGRVEVDIFYVIISMGQKVHGIKSLLMRADGKIGDIFSWQTFQAL